MREIYRGSKAALNQFMRSYAARHSETSRAMVLMAPGWVRTGLGGPDARLSIDESVPNLVNVLLKKQGNLGLEYLDYLGRTVPWKRSQRLWRGSAFCTYRHRVFDFPGCEFRTNRNFNHLVDGGSYEFNRKNGSGNRWWAWYWARLL